MILRKITTEDNFAVKELIQTSLRGFNLAVPGTAYFDPQLAALADYYDSQIASGYWVVEKAGEIIACGGFGPFSGDARIGELQKLYVADAAQGQGLSKVLMEKILVEASNHYQQLYLETVSQLAVANALYQKYDFRLLDKPLAGSEHGLMDTWYIRDL